MKKAILIISLVVVLVCGVFIFYKYQKISNIYDSMYFNFLKFGEIESEIISVEEIEYPTFPSNGDWNNSPGGGNIFKIYITDGKDVRIGGSKVEDIYVQRDTKTSNIGPDKGGLSIEIWLDSDERPYKRIRYNVYDVGEGLTIGNKEPEKSEVIEVVNKYVIEPFLEVQSSRFTTTNWGIE